MRAFVRFERNARNNAADTGARDARCGGDGPLGVCGDVVGLEGYHAWDDVLDETDAWREGEMDVNLLVIADNWKMKEQLNRCRRKGKKIIRGCRKGTIGTSQKNPGNPAPRLTSRTP